MLMPAVLPQEEKRLPRSQSAPKIPLEIQVMRAVLAGATAYAKLKSGGKGTHGPAGQVRVARLCFELLNVKTEKEFWKILQVYLEMKKDSFSDSKGKVTLHDDSGKAKILEALGRIETFSILIVPFDEKKSKKNARENARQKFVDSLTSQIKEQYILLAKKSPISWCGHQLMSDIKNYTNSLVDLNNPADPTEFSSDSDTSSSSSSSKTSVSSKFARLKEKQPMQELRNYVDDLHKIKNEIFEQANKGIKDNLEICKSFFQAISSYDSGACECNEFEEKSESCGAGFDHIRRDKLWRIDKALEKAKVLENTLKDKVDFKDECAGKLKVLVGKFENAKKSFEETSVALGIKGKENDFLQKQCGIQDDLACSLIVKSLSYKDTYCTDERFLLFQKAEQTLKEKQETLSKEKRQNDQMILSKENEIISMQEELGQLKTQIQGLPVMDLCGLGKVPGKYKEKLSESSSKKSAAFFHNSLSAEKQKQSGFISDIITKFQSEMVEKKNQFTVTEQRRIALTFVLDLLAGIGGKTVKLENQKNFLENLLFGVQKELVSAIGKADKDGLRGRKDADLLRDMKKANFSFLSWINQPSESKTSAIQPT